ncbi:MAG TPA: hypothetical protein VHN11_00660 [Xanthobacteraceae bacterium]|jgi:hypothetical protein|nr:hypothetical protein [Xanthobacteraceae bacterium]
MADYRIYFVGEAGHFCDVMPLACANDAEAVEQAKRVAAGRAVELWQLDRKVAVFPDQNKTP